MLEQLSVESPNDLTDVPVLLAAAPVSEECLLRPSLSCATIGTICDPEVTSASFLESACRNPAFRRVPLMTLLTSLVF